LRNSPPILPNRAWRSGWAYAIDVASLRRRNWAIIAITSLRQGGLDTAHAIDDAACTRIGTAVMQSAGPAASAKSNRFAAQPARSSALAVFLRVDRGKCAAASLFAILQARRTCSRRIQRTSLRGGTGPRWGYHAPFLLIREAGFCCSFLCRTTIRCDTFPIHG